MTPGRIAVAIIFLSFVSCPGQTVPVVSQPTTRLAFDVASVRQNNSGSRPSSNVPLGPGNVWGPSGGVLSAKNFTLLTYIEFAYKMTDYQAASVEEKLPEWAANERFDIEARTDNVNVTKDQMRQMMQSLLPDRFGLAVHYELRNVPVYALEPVHAGEFGPKLRAHPADAICPNYSVLSQTPEGKPANSLPDNSADGFPTFCGGILGVPASAQDRYSFGARDVPMSTIASSFSSWGNLGRPVVDETGLKGTYDFVLDFTPDPRPKYATIDSGGPTFQQALKQQLGLKLEPSKRDVDFLVLDHVEHPTEN